MRTGRKTPPCGNPRCGVSTGIHGGLTFGWGDLDQYGYWEHPCGVCARACEERSPEDVPCWPFKPKREPRKPDRAENVLAAHHMLEDAKEDLGKLMGLLKNLSDTLGDLGAESAENMRIIGQEVAGPLSCIMDNLDKVRVPEE